MEGPGDSQYALELLQKLGIGELANIDADLRDGLGESGDGFLLELLEVGEGSLVPVADFGREPVLLLVCYFVLDYHVVTLCGVQNRPDHAFYCLVYEWLNPGEVGH